MGRPIARFTASRIFILLTLSALGGAVFSTWYALRWAPSWIAAVMFAIPALVLAAVTIRPVIEIFQTHLAIGRRLIAWRDVRRVDHTGWNTPLIVVLILHDRQRIHLLYPGDLDSSSSLLRHIRQLSREALLDGVPYRKFWAEAAHAAPPLQSTVATPSAKAPGLTTDLSSTGKDAQGDALVRYPVLRTEDEEEVERLFQRLKSVGHLESKSSDEK